MILCYFPINQNNFLHNVIAGILPQFLKRIPKRIPKRIHCALGHNCLGNFLKNAVPIAAPHGRAAVPSAAAQERGPPA